ncbi:four-helix bundle copper-binding protein [Ktedonosporobacter rubrisoli]|uniref:Four-helix bundle copper-binding protein n=1 Tax=Ktedonosporobacter rubrisoli TaxID=2509675 RepID=A0A4P6K3B5_KTERU|nr:four-helix bundle copper-binding protein [Ktedonosporobacter rubrisoli]QBD82669.1 four-helix bundle copper-binding protein [Ktedonosporobacter rubrisoli]
MQGTHAQQSMQQCTQNCKECHAICEQTLLYSLQKGGPFAQADHILALLDCIQTCQVSEDFMLRNSPLHPYMCGVCAEACQRCAQFGNDQQLQACAQACRSCAATCQQMASTP